MEGDTKAAGWAGPQACLCAFLTTCPQGGNSKCTPDEYMCMCMVYTCTTNSCMGRCSGCTRQTLRGLSPLCGAHKLRDPRLETSGDPPPSLRPILP
jgi:hypothetical protein